jgi:TolA-binding protein
MNKSEIIRLIIIFVTGVSLTGCNSNAKNVDAGYFNSQDTKNKTENPSQEIAPAQKDTNSDFQKFIKEANTKISSNEKNISELKLKSKEDKKEAKEEYFKTIEDLEKRNDVMKMKLYNYVHKGNGNWQTFKAEFYGDLDALETAINNAAIKDIK